MALTSIRLPDQLPLSDLCEETTGHRECPQRNSSKKHFMKPPGRIPEKIRSQQFFFILYSALDGIEYYCCGKFEPPNIIDIISIHAIMAANSQVAMLARSPLFFS